MPDTSRTRAALQTLLADNTSGAITAQAVRDMLVSVMTPQAVNGFRLTLTTAVPVTTSDVTGASTIYLTPYLHNVIGLYDGTSWETMVSAEVSLALGTLTSGKNYDVFAYDNSGTLTLELLAWTSDTARATALVMQDGVWCKTGALTRRYVGTVRTTATTTTEDSASKRFCWNAANQVRRAMKKDLAASSWTTTSTAATTAGSTANRVEYVAGLDGAAVDLAVSAPASNTTGSACSNSLTFGFDSTSAADTDTTAVPAYTISGSDFGSAVAEMRKAVALGYHYIQLLHATAAGTATFYRDTTPVSRIVGGLTC